MERTRFAANDRTTRIPSKHGVITAFTVLALASTLVMAGGNRAAYADIASEGPCTLQGDVRFLPTDAGGAVVASQLCNGNNVWETTATYSAADEKSVIWEPRFGDLNFTSGGPNPFTADYVYSKAQALFPAPGSFQIAYARNALDPKNRAKDSRNQTAVDDQCAFYPKPFTDESVKANRGWLAPVATFDGKVGTLSYTITGMTGDGVSGTSQANGDTIRSAITQYNEAAEATNNPILVPWKIGDPGPTIDFVQDPQLNPENGLSGSIARATTNTTVLDNGLARWVSGEIAISPDPHFVTAQVVAHEIVHAALGLAHISIASSAFTMSPSIDPSLGFSRSAPAIDACTEKGMQLAASTAVGP